MDPLLQGVIYTSGAGAVAFLVKLGLQHYLNLRSENQRLKDEEQAKDRKAILELKEELRDTRYAMAKLEVKLEVVEKILPKVEKAERDIHTLFAKGRTDGTESH